MAVEEGIITGLKEKTALVKTKRTASCEACSERASCRSIGGNEMEVEAINRVNAEIGDLVVVSSKTSQLFLLSFFLYVFPIIVLIIGALIGDHLARSSGGNPSTYAALIGFTFFFAAIGIVKLKDRKARKTGQYRPEIIRIKKKSIK
jgi:sigma-E factor negative regulatory protein RseC